MKIIVKQFGKVVDEFKDGVHDCYNHVSTWAEAMNYIETDGGRTAGGGYVYYDTVKEAAEDLLEGGAFSTLEEVEDFYKKNAWLIGELSDGEIIFEEEEDER